MNQHGKNNHIQSRPCPRCSVVQRTQVRCTTEYVAEQQDPGPSDVSSAFIITMSPVIDDDISIQKRQYPISKPEPELQ